MCQPSPRALAAEAQARLQMVLAGVVPHRLFTMAGPFSLWQEGGEEGGLRLREAQGPLFPPAQAQTAWHLGRFATEEGLLPPLQTVGLTSVAPWAASFLDLAALVEDR